ncbi:MAG: nucleotidyltransferase [Ardenticatenales bacterium]|nr:nucleotidyltransferase [Ardenticatenales bacterium]
MNKKASDDLRKIFQNLTDWLDISATHFERAETRYKAIGDWLSRPASVVAIYDPEIFPQGSFSLGTVIKPATNEEEYDIDLVCKIKATKLNMSQKRLKLLIGQELISYAKAQNMTSPPEERRRSWRMDYADQPVHFHLDVLPAIPDDENLRDDVIAITDNQLSNYGSITTDWPHSNPVGYAAWFRERMRVRLEIMRRELAEALKANIEDVPDYKIKTPLQRTIQILKRHRDVTYKGEPEDKPISILITTLAACAYQNESDLDESLLSIVTGMQDYIEDRNGVFWVSNPADPRENFADKWEQYPARKEAFLEWLVQIEIDILSLFAADDVVSLKADLQSQFGEHATNAAIKGLQSNNIFELDASSNYDLLRISGNPNQFAVAHRQSPKWHMRLDQNVYVSAFVIRDGFRKKRVLSGEPMSKHRALEFAAIHNIKKPYEIYWQVVNTGREAQEADALRGGFYDSTIGKKGKLIRKESTLYEGKHWITCFVVKRGVCIARSREFVVNIVK